MYKSTQALILMFVLLLFLLIAPTALPETRFKMEPDKVAAAVHVCGSGMCQ